MGNVCFGPQALGFTVLHSSRYSGPEPSGRHLLLNRFFSYGLVFRLHWNCPGRVTAIPLMTSDRHDNEKWTRFGMDADAIRVRTSTRQRILCSRRYASDVDLKMTSISASAALCESATVGLRNDETGADNRRFLETKGFPTGGSRLCSWRFETAR